MARASQSNVRFRALTHFTVILSWAGACLAAAPPCNAQPNVLMIIADDLNRMISPLGDPNAITPNLQRLAARSVCFENATCQFPFCSPSRASIFLGLYPWLHGNQGAGAAYPNPHAVFPDRVGLPEYFRNNGYWTASYGKTEHHFKARNWDIQTTDHRYAPWLPDHDPAKLVHSDAIWARGITGSPQLRVYDLPPNEMVDGVSTTTALNDLTAHLAAPDPDPFFVAVGFHCPHDPWNVPRSIFDQYDTATLTLAPNPRGNWPAWAWQINNDQLDAITEERRRDLFHAYLSAVTLMDHQVGRLLDFVDTNALWDDTVVLFFSDNGWSMCEHQAMYAKRNITRENISVPLMIHAPGGGMEHVLCTRQVELQDLFPTLVDLCALPPYPSYLSGRSIKPLLLDPTQAWPHVAKAVLASNDSRPKAMIAQFGHLKIAQGGDTARNMYFDHAADPVEENPAWYPASNPPPDPRWTPLLNSLNQEFGFAVGQFRVFYAKNSTFAPDRDGDGMNDSTEIALGVLGFRHWVDDSFLSTRLAQGPVPISDGRGLPGFCLTMPEFTVTRPPGYEAMVTPLELLETEDLETWTPSKAVYEEDPDGSFRWKDSIGPQKKAYRFALPRL